ncbi:MAG: DUF3795 domain-containing protein [archaeon]|nr:DUF3795 domain-containing protein [archaeon]
MEKIIAFCGLLCNECPAFQMVKNDDPKKRKETAEIWSKIYNEDIKPEEIYCTGCLSKAGKKYSHCNICEVRKCGQEKGLKNCAYCSEYVCEKLESYHRMNPEMKKILDEIRQGID